MTTKRLIIIVTIVLAVVGVLFGVRAFMFWATLLCGTGMIVQSIRDEES